MTSQELIALAGTFGAQHQWRRLLRERCSIAGATASESAAALSIRSESPVLANPVSGFFVALREAANRFSIGFSRSSPVRATDNIGCAAIALSLRPFKTTIPP